MQAFTLTPLLPELATFLGALVLLMLGAFRKNEDTLFTKRLSLAFIAAAGVLVCTLDTTNGVTKAFDGMFVIGSFSMFAKELILIGSFFVMMLVIGYYKDYQKQAVFEFPVLLLLAVTGMMLMVSANTLLALYMGLELQSLALYVMAAIHRDSPRSSEAGLKYFVLGALASGLFLYGASLVYGFSGTISFEGLASLYTAKAAMPVGVLVGMVLVIIAMAFKVSAVPFHMWTPDVYEGSPTPVTAFFAVAPKVAGLALFVRVVMEAFGGVMHDWQQVIIVISGASMVLGAFGALFQRNIKRLIAYSSITHVGFALMGLATGTHDGMRAILVYLSIYMVMSLGIFACIMLVRKKDHHLCEEIESFSGLSKTQPWLAACIAILMFSMAGIPPLAGFFAKFFVIYAAVQKGMIVLAVIGALASVVAAYYYLRVVKVMYFDDPMLVLDRQSQPEIRFVAIAASALNLLFFVYFTPLLAIAEHAVASLF